DLPEHVFVGRVRPAELAVTVTAARPDALQKLCKFTLAGTVPQRSLEVRPGRGEQAGIQHPVRGYSRAAASAAERFRNRGDKADLPLPVLVFVPARDLPRI